MAIFPLLKCTFPEYRMIHQNFIAANFHGLFQDFAIPNPKKTAAVVESKVGVGLR